MIGAQGIVLDRLDPEGYILVHGERWKAVLFVNGPPIEKGQKVLVQGRKGLSLRVKSDAE